MGDRLGFLSVTGALLAAVIVVVLAAWTVVSGPVLFSPGGLNSVAHARTLGGVTSHAQLEGRCEACHTLPWNSRTMADRCMACHTDVGLEIRARNGFHGGLSAVDGTLACRDCHPEHNGPAGTLTTRVDHSKFLFKLTGKHADVACEGCHTSEASVRGMRNTPQGCFACHAKDDEHGGKFGRQCEQCHTPDSWTEATFDHKIFPVNHGGKSQGATCKTCHPVDVSAYSCFGCHEHTEANVLREHRGKTIAALKKDCLRCHPGGREGD